MTRSGDPGPLTPPRASESVGSANIRAAPPATGDAASLVEAARGGDRRATEALVRRLLPRVRNLARYLVGSDSEVEDMAQQSLIAIVRGLPNFRGEGRLESWADRITVRETLRYAKAKRARRRREEQAGEDPAWRPSLEGAPPGTRRELVRLLDRLPETQREAVVLHHVVGLSVPEAASQLGVSFDTLKSRLRLGMGKLREAAS